MFSAILDLYKRFKPFFRYCVVGTAGTLVDVVSLYIFVEFAKLPLLIATTLSFLLAVTNNFLLNKIWTFQNKSKNYRKLYMKFLIVSCVGLVITNLTMYIQVEFLGIWYILAKLITSALVLTWNFLGNKYWTFIITRIHENIPDAFIYDFSIIIPAYNEEHRLKPTLLLINDFIQQKNLNAEIIVVDDGSIDQTPHIVKSKQDTIKNLFLMSERSNKGKGYAVKKGIERAQGKYILITDADNSTPIEEFDKLYAKIKEGFDIAIGSRYLHGSDVIIRQPRSRVMIGRIGNLLIRMFLVNHIKDTQCGFKMFKARVAKDIFRRQKVNRWGFDMEIISVAQLLNYKIAEVPVSWYNSAETRLRPIRDSMHTLWELIYIKLNMWSGRYEE